MLWLNAFILNWAYVRTQYSLMWCLKEGVRVVGWGGEREAAFSRRLACVWYSGQSPAHNLDTGDGGERQMPDFHEQIPTFTNQGYPLAKTPSKKTQKTTHQLDLFPVHECNTLQLLWHISLTCFSFLCFLCWHFSCCFFRPLFCTWRDFLGNVFSNKYSKYLENPMHFSAVFLLPMLNSRPMGCSWPARASYVAHKIFKDLLIS